MRPVRVLSLYFAFIFLGGALIAPWLYHFVQITSGVVPGFHALAAKPFSRYLNRSLLILALAGLLPFLRATDLRSWRALGLGRRPGAMRQLGWGLVLGFGSLACAVLIALASGVRQAAHDFTFTDALIHCSKALLAALFAAPLEELVFRGALFGSLRKTFHWTMALGLSSGLYAILHFLDHPAWHGAVVWSSGLAVLGAMLSGFAAVDKLALLNLTLVGIILALAYQRSGSLYLPIGLHAGWIFWLKTYGFLTKESPGSSTWFFGTGKLIDGWLAFGILAVVLAALSRVMAQAEPHTGWKERRLFS